MVVRPETTVIYGYVSYDLFFILNSDYSFSLFYHCILHNLLIITE